MQWDTEEGFKKIYTRRKDREQTETRPRIEKPIREATLIDNEAPG